MNQTKTNGQYTKTYIRFMRNAYRRYLDSKVTSIYSIYINPSKFKRKAWDNIKEKAWKKPYIIGYNDQTFTAAYFVYEGFDEYFIVETADNTYAIQAELLEYCPYYPDL